MYKGESARWNVNLIHITKYKLRSSLFSSRDFFTAVSILNNVDAVGERSLLRSVRMHSPPSPVRVRDFLETIRMVMLNLVVLILVDLQPAWKLGVSCL